MQLLQRKRTVVIGSLLAVLPVLFWIVLPVGLFEKAAIFFRVDDRLLEDWAFLLGAFSEMTALYFLDRFSHRPWDRLSAGALVAGAFAIVAVVVFFFAIVGNTMQGW
jgi:peptidoglycan/LPS O-acetylase OafA/YrhL